MPLPDQHLSVRPPSSSHIVGLLALLVLVSVGGASQLTYAKKEYVEGIMQARGGELRVVAPSRGIVSYSAKVGDVVTPNQEIAFLETRDVLQEGGTLRASDERALADKRVSLREELTGTQATLAARADALGAQYALARVSVNQARAEVESRRQFMLLEQRKLTRQATLRSQGFISAPAVEQAESDLLARQAELQAAERAVTQAESGLAAVAAEQAAHAAQASGQRQQLGRELLELDQVGARSQREARVGVVAPRQATVAARATAEGDSVEAGQLLLQLSPTGAPLDAILLLPATAAGRVTPGRHVSLQMSAYPYQTYGLIEAVVTHVDKSPLRADDAKLLHGSGLPASAMVVTATARLTRIPPAIKPIHSGMHFRAAVELERKSFLAWMAAPLLKNFQ